MTKEWHVILRLSNFAEFRESYDTEEAAEAAHDDLVGELMCEFDQRNENKFGVVHFGDTLVFKPEHFVFTLVEGPAGRVRA